MPRKPTFIGAPAAPEPTPESAPAAPEQAARVSFTSEHASLIVRAGSTVVRFVDGMYTTGDADQIALLRGLAVCREVAPR